MKFADGTPVAEAAAGERISKFIYVLLTFTLVTTRNRAEVVEVAACTPSNI